MADENVRVVRRSFEDEILERIVNKFRGDFESGLAGWAYSELGADPGVPLPVKEVDEFEREELLRNFGPLRLDQELTTEERSRFVKLVSDAYNDAKGYVEFSGIEIPGTCGLKS